MGLKNMKIFKISFQIQQVAERQMQNFKKQQLTMSNADITKVQILEVIKKESFSGCQSCGF